MLEYLTHMLVPTPTRANMRTSMKRHREYDEVRVREIEHRNFCPLVFSSSGGMGASTTIAYKRLAFLLSRTWKTPYSYCSVMSWLRCRLGFSLLQSAIMCIRGCRSSSGHPFKGHIPSSVDLEDAYSLGRFKARPLFLFSILSFVL